PPAPPVVAEPPPAAPPSPPAPAPAPEPPARAEAPARQPPPAPARQAAAPAADTRFHPADELTQLPVPQGDPDLRGIAPQLVARRLQLELWIDAAGTVQKAAVARNEVSDELAARLEQAVAQVRFQPARQQDRPAAAAVRTLLCFDDAGLLETSADECWKPQPKEGR
ncbi:MAG TPA: hypothetical protein VFM98_08935, partial [Ramlibacter sp.]|uniref:energy transducer TonB n=1 Tax=Ramlibacter sp. TaxID=1917967 RepID=UPI002D7F3500